MAMIVGGRGAAQSPKIFNMFLCDISPITKKSSRLVSHFLYRILLRVISKGRDKIVEIGE